MGPRTGTIVFELKTLDNLLRKNFEAAFREVDRDEQLTRMHHWIIAFLYDRRNQDVYQRDVESEFRISRSTTSSMVTLMEKKGLILRQGVSGDARLKKLLLTEKAIALHLQQVDRIQEVENRVESAITPEEKAELIRILHKLRDQVAASLIQPVGQTDK